MKGLAGARVVPALTALDVSRRGDLRLVVRRLGLPRLHPARRVVAPRFGARPIPMALEGPRRASAVAPGALVALGHRDRRRGDQEGKAVVDGGAGMRKEPAPTRSPVGAGVSLVEGLPAAWFASKNMRELRVP